MKLLYFGDPHIRGTSPRNRTDDYKEKLKSKLREVFALAKKHQVTAIIQPGDTFDRPEVSITVLLEFAQLLKESPVPIYTTPGNHDIYGYNLGTYERTSLKLLSLLVPQLVVMQDPRVPEMLVDQDGKGAWVGLTFTPYSGKMDRNGYGYSPELEYEDHVYSVHVAHGMLLDHVPPFDRYSLVQDVETTADLVLTGHDHIGYDQYYREKDGVVFYNPGSLTRLSASQGEIERQVKVLLLEFHRDSGETNRTLLTDIKEIPLEAAAPGDEVLDRTQIEAEKKRQYAMDEFAALIQNDTGDQQLLDINQIVETIAEKEDFKPEVIRAALEKIDQARETI